MAGRRPAQIVEGPDYCTGRDELVPDTALWDRVWRGIEWTLARDPRGFDRVAGLNLHAIRLRATHWMPAALIFYRLDGEVVHLVHCEEAARERA